MAPASDHPVHLPPSQLGTKEYWDSLYTTELSNHTSNPSDKGTVWFDDSDAEAKIVSYLLDLTTQPTSSLSAGVTPPPQTQQFDATSAPRSTLPLDQRKTSFLDLGCGNGSLLLALRAEGWQGAAMGVDYSPQSIALARQVALAAAGCSLTRTTDGHGEQPSDAQQQQQQQHEDSDEDESPEIQGADTIQFTEWSITSGDTRHILQDEQRGGWDVVLDKGTFDAISLSDEKDMQGRRLCEGYRERVLMLLRRKGLFLVTSCNWTEAELRGWFEEELLPNRHSDGERFRLFGKVDYPTFSFGGVKGQTITTLCFQKS